MVAIISRRMPLRQDCRSFAAVSAFHLCLSAAAFTLLISARFSTVCILLIWAGGKSSISLVLIANTACASSLMISSPVPIAAARTSCFVISILIILGYLDSIEQPFLGGLLIVRIQFFQIVNVGCFQACCQLLRFLVIRFQILHYITIVDVGQLQCDAVIIAVEPVQHSLFQIILGHVQHVRKFPDSLIPVRPVLVMLLVRPHCDVIILQPAVAADIDEICQLPAAVIVDIQIDVSLILIAVNVCLQHSVSQRADQICPVLDFLNHCFHGSYLTFKNSDFRKFRFRDFIIAQNCIFVNTKIAIFQNRDFEKITFRDFYKYQWFA